MQRRILVPTDCSPLSDRILTQVRRLLVRQDSEVVLLHVVEPKADVPAAELVQNAKDHLLGVRDDLVAAGATATVEIVPAGPDGAAGTIVDEAARRGASLVAMSTHGRSGVARWVRGSVAERVVRASTTPVLLANPRALTDEPTELRFERILVPLDGSELSLGVLPHVEQLARLYGSEVVLLQVEWAAGGGTLYHPAEVTMIRRPAEIEALLEPHRDRLEKAGIKARCLAAYGPEAVEIVEAAEREQASLVAMSTHGRSGFGRWVFGSVAEQVIRHCTRPLLVRRAPKEG